MLSIVLVTFIAVIKHCDQGNLQKKVYFWHILSECWDLQCQSRGRVAGTGERANLERPESFETSKLGPYDILPLPGP